MISMDRYQQIGTGQRVSAKTSQSAHHSKILPDLSLKVPLSSDSFTILMNVFLMLARHIAARCSHVATSVLLNRLDWIGLHSRPFAASSHAANRKTYTRPAQERAKRGDRD